MSASLSNEQIIEIYEMLHRLSVPELDILHASNDVIRSVLNLQFVLYELSILYNIVCCTSYIEFSKKYSSINKTPMGNNDYDFNERIVSYVCDEELL